MADGSGEKLPTSDDDEEMDKEEHSEDYVVDLGGSYVHYHRGLDGKLRSREYLAEDLISDKQVSDDDLRKGAKTIDIDAIRVIQEADKGPVRALAKGALIEAPPLLVNTTCACAF